MKEVKEWMEMAEKDLKRARLLFDNEDYEGSAFHSHQAAEKALKALYILKFKRLWKIHDLEKLASTVKAKKKIKEVSRELNPHYVETRYPTKIEYTKEIAKNAVKNAEEVLEWVKEKLKRSRRR